MLHKVPECLWKAKNGTKTKVAICWLKVKRRKKNIYIYRVGGSILGPFYMNLFLGKLWYGLKQNLGDPSWYDWPLRFWLFWNVFPEYSFVKLRISLDPNIGWIEAHGCMLIWCCAVIFHVKRLVCRVGVGFQIRLLHHFCCDRFFCCE